MQKERLLIRFFLETGNIITMIKANLKKLYLLLVSFFILNCCLSIFSALNLGGVRFFTNKSYSMAPAVPKGSLSIVMGLPYYDPGDIIVYYALINHHEEIISHRIYRIGGNVYLAKGDNNLGIDPTIILPRLIIGKVFFVIPYIGDYIAFIKNPLGLFTFIYFPAFFIISYELYKIKKMF